ncbi:8-oxo-dGTP diphosphatase [Paenibacillus phyllosphaerae]|uniref:8-oxo-dGTP diphosphatase n=1 Tax=Paenibacillus phyllosphaerae TaxID=274593 RepID=A0A7W5FPB4_9BACL|nr:NUDIX domain-containing protein [Paenibacillus phyllosphaerae]MBB3112196.1 8-oxo-dGTP diphosphatase [Paenibacillus phyllosphaerae]
MQGYNVLMIFNPEMDLLLLCKRAKDPYKGLYNLVGGKIEPGEAGLAAAYRELLEETSISEADVTLLHMMDFTYHWQQCYVEVYAGRLKREVEAAGDEQDLSWSPLDRDFFDMSVYASEGNIGHMLEQAKLYREKLMGED